MISRRKKTINWLLALLLTAQLCSAAHAAEYGSGPHSHGDIVCLHAVGNDDDPGTVQNIGLVLAWLTDQGVESSIPDSTPKNCTALPPPATGPPSIS